MSFLKITGRFYNNNDVCWQCCGLSRIITHRGLDGKKSFDGWKSHHSLPWSSDHYFQCIFNYGGCWTIPLNSRYSKRLQYMLLLHFLNNVIDNPLKIIGHNSIVLWTRSANKRSLVLFSGRLADDHNSFLLYTFSNCDMQFCIFCQRYAYVFGNEESF